MKYWWILTRTKQLCLPCSTPRFILLKLYQCRVDVFCRTKLIFQVYLCFFSWIRFLWLFVILIHVTYAFVVICSYFDYIYSYFRETSQSVALKTLIDSYCLISFWEKPWNLKTLTYLTLAELSFLYSTLFKDVAFTHPLFLSWNVAIQ